LEYRAWQDSDNEKALDVRLALWAKRTDLKETSAESAFIDVFFRETWGYVQTGQRGSETRSGHERRLRRGLADHGPRT
jgi:hypothetical protein